MYTSISLQQLDVSDVFLRLALVTRPVENDVSFPCMVDRELEEEKRGSP